MDKSISLAARTEQGFVMDFDSKVYSQQAIKKAFYKLGNYCSCKIELQASKNIHVVIIPQQDCDIDALAALVAQEVLDQDLRESIAKETEAVRNLILAQAFSATSLLSSDSDTADYRDDPRGISHQCR